MRTRSATLFILALAAAMALSGASCRRIIGNRTNPPPAAKESAKNPAENSGNKAPAPDPCATDPSQCDKPVRGELQRKSRTVCTANRDNCKTLQRIRKTIRTHCETTPDLCKKTRPQVKTLTKKALDVCIADQTQCAKALEQLESDAFAAVQIK